MLIVQEALSVGVLFKIKVSVTTQVRSYLLPYIRLKATPYRLTSASGVHQLCVCLAREPRLSGLPLDGIAHAALRMQCRKPDAVNIRCFLHNQVVVPCRRGRDTAKPQFISEFSVRASRQSTDSWRDLPSRDPNAASSDRTEPRRSVLSLCAIGRPCDVLQDSTAQQNTPHLWVTILDKQQKEVNTRLLIVTRLVTSWVGTVE